VGSLNHAQRDAQNVCALTKVDTVINRENYPYGK